MEFFLIDKEKEKCNFVTILQYLARCKHEAHWLSFWEVDGLNFRSKSCLKTLKAVPTSAIMDVQH